MGSKDANQHGASADPGPGGGPSASGRPHLRTWGWLRSRLRGFDEAFTRHATAVAMAEDGSRALALEMLDPPDGRGAVAAAGLTSGGGANPGTQGSSARDEGRAQDDVGDGDRRARRTG